MFDFLTRPWLMAPAKVAAYRALAAQTMASGRQPEKKAMLGAGVGGEAPYARAGSVAVIQVCGPLYHGHDLFADWMGWCSYQDLIAATEAAAADSTVARIVFEVNSPGGESAGITELYNAVKAAAAQKPCVAVARNLMCSAAYIALCAVQEIVVTPTAETGSVGTYFLLEDWSEFYAKAGIKTVPVASGDLKTAGAFGTEITADQVAMFKASVDEHFEWICSVVSENRGVSVDDVKAMRGAFFPANLTVKNKLADRVAEWADVLAGEMVPGAAAYSDASEPGAEPGATEDPMDLKSLKIDELSKERPDLVASLKAQGVTESAEKPATIAQLKAEFAGESDFVLGQAEAGATISAAKVAFAGVLKTRLEAKDAELKAANEKLAAAPKPGAPVHRGRATPLALAGGDGGQGEQDGNFEDKLQAKTAELMEKDRISSRQARDRAMSLCAKEFPKLHAAWKSKGCGVPQETIARTNEG